MLSVNTYFFCLYIMIPIILIIVLLFISIVLLISPKNMCTPFQGGKIKCNKLKFIKEGEDTCWIDTSMYVMIIPEESYTLIKNKMYDIPELYSYVKILRRNKNSIINRCTPGGGNELTFIEKMIKTMGMSYKHINNIDRIPVSIINDYPDYLFYINKINKKIPKIPNLIINHCLIGMIFHIEYKNRPEMGHVACVVKCGKNEWRYYNNCSHKVYNLKEKDHNEVAERVHHMLQVCKYSGGSNSRVDEILCIYCLK